MFFAKVIGHGSTLLRKYEMKNFAKLLAVLLAAVVLVACGGGGSSAVATNTEPQGYYPQGYWSGLDNSTGYTVNTAILNNAEVWGIYTANSKIYGALYGTSSVNGNAITVTGTSFDFLSNKSSQGTTTGPVTAKSTMTLSGVVFKYQNSYDAAATLSAIAGTWSINGRSGSYALTPAVITINTAGNFTLAQSTCTTSGSVVPRAGGKNIYSITLTATGTTCATGQSALSGILYIDTTVTPYQFLSLALTPNKNDGLIVIGTKM